MTPGETAEFHTDDAPRGEGARLEVSPAGNGDWYLVVKWKDREGLWRRSEAVRFSTSGSAHSVEVTLAIAMLGFLGNGETERARGCAASIVRGLATGAVVWVIYEDPSDFPGKFVVRRRMVLADGAEKVARDPDAVVDDLESARAAVPDGLMVFPRDPTDDPVIVETWM